MNVPDAEAYENFKKAFDALAADCDAKTRAVAPAGTPEDRQRTVVADNMLKFCIEQALNHMLPISPEFCAEIAVRIASYALSAAPTHMHGGLVAMCVEVLPEVHASRMERGICIKSEWETVGSVN